LHCRSGPSPTIFVRAQSDFSHQALRDDPKYVKALQRRAAANEVINSWTSLSAAAEGIVSVHRHWAFIDLPPDRLHRSPEAPVHLFSSPEGDGTISAVVEASR